MNPCTADIGFARALAAALLSLTAAAAVAQQPYPNKPMRFITPFAPGGQTSILARLFGQKLTESWGQPVIVDNRPGGNTIIGTEALARATPDGYTLIMTTNSHVIIPHLHAKLPFDPIKDFAPVAMISSNETLMLVHPAVPAQTLQELIALAKAKPGQLNYASLGTGGIQHLSSEMFNLAAGVKIQGIPYKGAGPAIVDLIGGQVQLSIQGPATSLPHVKSGKLRALAITGASRWSALPQVPTFAESGLPGYDMKYWQAVLAPAGTPSAIIEKLAAEIRRIQNLPDTRERLVSQGLDPWITTPAEFAALLKTEMAKYGKIIQAANIKLDQ
jgi:tripartite-type tricarboxylate transporter receptor subunit TctC